MQGSMARLYRDPLAMSVCKPDTGRDNLSVPANGRVQTNTARDDCVRRRRAGKNDPAANSAGGYGWVRIGTDHYGETGAEIDAPAFAEFRHSHWRTGSNHSISVFSVSSVFSVFRAGFLSVIGVCASNVER